MEPLVPIAFTAILLRVSICPVFRYGVMRELYIDPLQQPQYEADMFRVELEGRRITVMSYSGYPLLECDRRVWKSSWCRDHKCYSLRMYVGDGVNTLIPALRFGSEINLEFRRGG